jgi:hypothetical protein
MVSIMQKINEDVMSVIEYMANGMPTIQLQAENRVYTLSLRVDEVKEVEE